MNGTLEEIINDPIFERGRYPRIIQSQGKWTDTYTTQHCCILVSYKSFSPSGSRLPNIFAAQFEHRVCVGIGIYIRYIRIDFWVLI